MGFTSQKNEQREQNRRRERRVSSSTSLLFFSLVTIATRSIRSNALSMSSIVKRRTTKREFFSLEDLVSSHQALWSMSTSTTPNMFLTGNKLSAVSVTTSSQTQSTPTTVPIQVEETNSRNRGILGFRLDEAAEEQPPSPRLPSSLQAHRHHNSGRTNVDIRSWNVPRTWTQANRRIWTPTPLSWFPWIPTDAQIDALKLVELKSVCQERGLAKTGNKPDLQQRLKVWTRQQMEQRRSVNSSLNLFQAYGVQQHNNDSTIQGSDQSETQTKLTEETSTIGPNSLAEWARTVDLEPLLQRREAIHREKLQGKSVPKTTSTPDTSTPSSQEQYLSVLNKVFEKPSSPYSNLQVKQMYQAAKQADQQGDRELSKRILVKLKQATPHDARIYRRLARMEKEEGNMSAARAILQEGLRLHPDNAFLWHGLGQMAASDSDTKKYWRKAIQVDPSFPHPYHSLGTLEHTQGRIANAMKTLKRGVEYCPKNHRLHHALGDLYRDAKMLDMAERSYQKALKHGPPVSHGFAYTGLAYTAYEDNQIDRCRSWSRRAIIVNNGRYANGWVALAQMEESEGNIDAARAVCIAGLQQYERGLLERSRKLKFRERTEEELFLKDPVALKNRFLKSVPSYRSGDRFYNLYRNWARLEERHGTIESVEEVYERASVAFPREWRLTLDWAQYYVKKKMYSRARVVFEEACNKAANHHADPYRIFAEFEISLGNYAEARKILYRGSMALSQASDGGLGNRYGLAELFHTWAVCEWHLEELSRAEVLFDHALRMTNAGEEGSKLRSFILYSIARLEYYRGEYLLAQHCIGLCLKENLMPGGNSKIWDLWANVADKMGNADLSRECQEQAALAKSHEDENGPTGLSRLLSSSSGLSRMKGPDMENLMRRDPWHHKLFGSMTKSSFFHGVQFPDTVEPFSSSGFEDDEVKELSEV